MNTKLSKIKNFNTKDNLVFLIKDLKKDMQNFLSDDEFAFVKTKFSQKKKLAVINRLKNYVYVQRIEDEKNSSKKLESCRKNGEKLCSLLNMQKVEKISVIDKAALPAETLAFAEGMVLGNYQFLKYTTAKDDKKNSLSEIQIVSEKLNNKDIKELCTIAEANFVCRSLVNEPVSYLNTTKFSEEIVSLFQNTEAKVEVFNKKKIESLKMGGLLAVNQGSVDPPVFTIIEWNPKNAKNKKPYVFVGKGIVYDTGGVNLKPASSMDDMKCDMAGGAAVVGALYAIAKAELPFYIVGLIPATDNRPSGNAYVSGDIIRMFDGTTVEVRNTDAEGRLILADALAYAKQYKPRLVIDLATLTGAAQRAIGIYGSVAMGSNSQQELEQLKHSGERVYERIVEFPFWEEYAEEIKSDIADIKNTGSNMAGAITAGKFLEHFTDYPYIHIDIAGTAFLEKKDSYRGKGATGVGVRLLFDFMKHLV